MAIAVAEFIEPPDDPFAVGVKFEKWLAEQLSLSLVDNIEWQTTKGDTLCCREIKYDRKRHSTHNLFIETAEAGMRAGNWHDAAITQQARFLLIGDCSIVWEFTQESILAQLEARADQIMELGRARGFLIEEALANEICIKRREFPYEPLAIELE